MADLSQRGSLGVRQLQPPLRLGLQDPIFGGQIFDPRQQLKIEDALERDTFLTSEMAKEFGIDKRPEPPSDKV
jgi:hypothetical protein